jgi:late competence protein required for DNA uptake (superfamily II DNA/RNA helicase)
MGLLDMLFPTVKNSITEIPAKIGGLHCERCSGEGLELYVIEPDHSYYCAECAEGYLRRKQFEDEEKDWNNK